MFEARIGEYEDEQVLGVFESEQEAYAAVGRYAVEQNDWLRFRSYVEEV